MKGFCFSEVEALGFWFSGLHYLLSSLLECHVFLLDWHFYTFLAANYRFSLRAAACWPLISVIVEEDNLSTIVEQNLSSKFDLIAQVDEENLYFNAVRSNLFFSIFFFTSLRYSCFFDDPYLLNSYSGTIFAAGYVVFSLRSFSGFSIWIFLHFPVFSVSFGENDPGTCWFSSPFKGEQI